MARLLALFKYSILLYLIKAMITLPSAGLMKNAGNDFIGTNPKIKEKIPMDSGQQCFYNLTGHNLASQTLHLSDNSSRATLAGIWKNERASAHARSTLQQFRKTSREEKPKKPFNKEDFQNRTDFSLPAGFSQPYVHVEEKQLVGKIPGQITFTSTVKEKHSGFSIGRADQLSGKFASQFATVSDAERKRLKIAVLVGSTFNQCLEVSHDQKLMAGLPIDAFESVVRVIPYKLTYKMIPFDGSYDDLLKEVALKNFDAAVGNILIRAEAYQLVEFSQPYVDVGLKMVVTTTTRNSDSWLFIRTFTRGMWLTIGVMSVFTGFVVWFIEESPKGNDDSSNRAFGTVLLFFFATLCNWQRDSSNNSLSLFVRGPWFILVLVVTSTFTASFTSMITNPQFEPSVTDIDVLKRTNSAVGCDGSSFTIQYLVKVLGFRPENIRNIFSIDDCASAISSGHIKAAFIQMPYAKVLLGKYCGSFTIAGPTYKLGSLGFVFSKGSALALDMSQAILKLSESGELQLIEEEMLSNFNFSAPWTNANVTQSLGPRRFIGLFVISGGASVIALLITAIRLLKHQWDKVTGSQAAMDRHLWICVLTLFTQQNQKSELQLARRSSMPQTAV